jgi:hypothetical protein
MKVDETVKEILTIVSTLSEQDMGSLSQDTLSRLALKLASYKASLGEPVAFAHKQAMDAEATYQEARANAYKKLRDDGKGSTDASELKHLHTQESFLAWNKARYDHRRLAQLSTDCHDLIDSLRGRIITLTTERKEADG